MLRHHFRKPGNVYRLAYEIITAGVQSTLYILRHFGLIVAGRQYLHKSYLSEITASTIFSPLLLSIADLPADFTMSYFKEWKSRKY